MLASSRGSRAFQVNRFSLVHLKGYNLRSSGGPMYDGDYVYCPYCGLALEVKKCLAVTDRDALVAALYTSGIRK
jgi:hypothetical protein